MISKLSSVKILGTNITTASKMEILEYVVKKALNKQDKVPIVTPNPEILMYALRHKDYQALLNRAEIATPDGIGVLISGRILKKGIKSRITGVDLMDNLCSIASERALTIGFLGGKDGVAERAALCLVKKYPDLIVNYASDEWNSGKINFDMFHTEARQKYNLENPPRIFNRKHIDILFVAFGFPKQEEWIDKNLNSIPVTVAIGVGGAFDYFSGDVKRAPKFVRDIGMEWAFRLVKEPWRFKRQTALPQFAFEVLKERFKR